MRRLQGILVIKCFGIKFKQLNDWYKPNMIIHMETFAHLGIQESHKCPVRGTALMLKSVADGRIINNIVQLINSEI